MKPSKDQMDKGLAFNGQGGEGFSRNSKVTSVQTNHHSGTMNEGKLVNKGRGPTKGNYDSKATQVGAPATKDKFREPPTASLPKLPKSNSTDLIKGSAQYRGQGGKSVEKPSNPDMIRIGQTGGPGYGATSKGKQVNKSTPNTFNYGPDSQY
jgi:hypothetical protein